MRAGGLLVAVPLLSLLSAAAGCGGPGVPISTSPRASSGAGSAPPAPSSPGLRIRLRPELTPVPRVHVDLDLTFDGPPPMDLAGLEVSPRNAVAEDDHGALPLTTEGAWVHLSRSPLGTLHVRYDAPAETTASVDPIATIVQEDRFRAAGERLLLLPTTPFSATRPHAPVDVRIDVDGSALKLARAASTMGLGLSETRTVRADGLLHASFVGGSLYTATFDAEARDEAAWLGYTAFDPRPASAEIAQIRTAIGEFFRSELPPFTTLFVSQARPLGSFSTHARAGGVLVLLGPSQTWDAALRLSITEQIVHGWIGGKIRLAAANDIETRQNAWFTDGVARFVAMRFLARLGLLTPDEVRAIVAGEMAAITTSPHRGESSAKLAADLRPTARAELVARGALAALRLHVLLRAKSAKTGARTFDDLLLALAAQAKGAPGPLPRSAWNELLMKELGRAELDAFTGAVDNGNPVVLPPHALGPCFRDGAADYVAFDLGFDEAQTLSGTPRLLRGLRADGPAARAGLRPEDELVALEEPGAGASNEASVVLTFRRDGKEESVTYAPRGARARGPAWTRLPSVASSRCGEVP